MSATRILAAGLVRKAARLRPGLATGCAGLALLAACASPHSSSNRYAGETTSYYLAHAAHGYNPPGPASDPWGPYIKEASTNFDVPEMWIRQVIRVESGGHQYSGGRLIVSSAGAMGLMQLEPGTYQEMAQRYGLGDDPFNPYDNIMAGTAYIHEMYQIYGSPGFLAAYNAGPGRLDSFVNSGRRLPSETVNYVAMIAPNIDGYYPKRRSAADQLALNTNRAGQNGGILPAGFSPQTPTPAQLSAPVQIASFAPPPASASGNSSGPAYSMPATVALGLQNSPASSTQMASVQSTPVASPAPAAAPVRVASIQPTPRPVAAPQPPTAAQIAAMAPIAAAPAVSPKPRPAAQPAGTMLASNNLPPPPPRPKPQGFSLIQPAMADTPPVERTAFSSGGSSWAIQVGAYDNPSNAKAALGMAELTGSQILTKAQPMVMTIHAGSGTKYRARFVGLRHEEAVNACSRLSGGPTGCVVLSPDAQS